MTERVFEGSVKHTVPTTRRLRGDNNLTAGSDLTPAQGSEPVVVVIGNFAHEGLTAKIQGLGFSAVNRQLRSTPKNWLDVTSQLHRLTEDGRLACVFVYLPSTMLMHVAEPVFDEVRPLLFAELERARALLFMFEDNLQGVIEPFPWELNPDPRVNLEAFDLPWRSEFTWGRTTREDWIEQHREEIERAIAVVADLSSRHLTVLPFRKRSDVTIQMFQALEDAQAGVFLRLYIPHGRYQSEQFEDFLALFSRFLREVEKREFTVDVQRTSQGTTYVFLGRGNASNLDDLRDASARFDSFLKQAQVAPKAAEQSLKSLGMTSSEAAFTVAKYARAAKRLVLESRHEFQRRHLMLLQEMETEALDAAVESELLPIPQEGSLTSMIAIVGNTGPISLSVGVRGAAGTASAAFRDSLAGHIDYADEDRAILARINDLNDELHALQLRSDLERLKDGATSPEEKRTAVQRLKAFLYASAHYAVEKVDHVATKVLIAYLEGQIPKS